MTRWRQGQSIPHHVYRQLGDEPDTTPWPGGDPPVATFLDPDAAELAVRAVNAWPARPSYRDGFDDGVRYARDHDAMTARMGSTPTDPGPDGERAMQCDSTWPLRPTPTTGHAACHLMLDHHGLHMDFAGQTWADETMNGTPTYPRRDTERGLSGKVSGLDREPTAGELGIAGGVNDELAMLLDQADRWFGGVVHTAHVRELLDRRGAGA